MALEIRHSGAPLGHEICGVDLAGDLPDDVFAQIEAAYDQHGVIVFRNQKLTPEQQIAFSRRFGGLDRFVLERYLHPAHPEIFVVSNVVENGRAIGLEDAGRYWHTDMWVKTTPPRGSALYALEVPRSADGQPLGDTYFTSTSAAYDALPSALRARIEGRTAVFSSTKCREFRMAQLAVDPVTGRPSPAALETMAERSAANHPDVIHPLVKVHPRSGRKCIYFSEGAVGSISGYSQEESDDLVEALRAHLLRPEFIYRHRWNEGDLVMWDNIACLHKATGDFKLPQRRLMHRTTLSALATAATREAVIA